MLGSDITFTMQPFAQGAHVCMTHKMPEHNTDGFECWCNPSVTVLCSECECRESEDCWKCDGEGWMRLDAFEAEMSGTFAIIVHNDRAKP